MNSTGRLITDALQEGPWNMAVDYHLLNQVSLGKENITLRFYGWEPPTVTIGYFQLIDDEIDLAAAKKRGVPVIRRITGGGAVFHMSEITYSICLPENHEAVQGSVEEAFEALTMPLVRALKEQGIRAEYKPLNDILVDGKKISGNAQTRKKGVILQHGTILLDLDLDTMFSVLQVPVAKKQGRSSTMPSGGVTSVNQILGDEAFTDNFKDNLYQSIISHYEGVLSCRFIDKPILPKESPFIEEFKKSHFENPNWNFKRTLGDHDVLIKEFG